MKKLAVLVLLLSVGSAHALLKIDDSFFETYDGSIYSRRAPKEERLAEAKADLQRAEQTCRQLYPMSYLGFACTGSAGIAYKHAKNRVADILNEK